MIAQDTRLVIDTTRWPAFRGFVGEVGGRKREEAQGFCSIPFLVFLWSGNHLFGWAVFTHFPINLVQPDPIRSNHLVVFAQPFHLISLCYVMLM